MASRGDHSLMPVLIIGYSPVYFITTPSFEPSGQVEVLMLAQDAKDRSPAPARGGEPHREGITLPETRNPAVWELLTHVPVGRFLSRFAWGSHPVGRQS
jgi:hypothetical protein